MNFCPVLFVYSFRSIQRRHLKINYRARKISVYLNNYNNDTYNNNNYYYNNYYNNNYNYDNNNYNNRPVNALLS